MDILAWFVVRLLINAGALIVISRLIAGFEVAGPVAAISAALILGLVNAFIRPVLLLLTLPINFLSLGLFTFFLNAALLLLVARVVPGFEITGFPSALIGALFLWLVSLITNIFFHGGR
jgi:putative membrane protein